MGLLDNWPDSFFKPIRDTAQNRNLDPAPGDANDSPPWVARGQQQRPPLSLAGLGLTADITDSSPSGGQSANPLRAQPVPTAQNLTAQALRTKGVPEGDLAAATGNLELMKQLIIQHYGPGPRSGLGPTQGPLQPQPVSFECEGFPAGCQNGGNHGENANYYAGGRHLCRDCTVRYLGIQDEPAIIKIDALKRWEKN
jgi:hypothetical protein